MTRESDLDDATLILFQSWLFYLLYSLTEMTLTLSVVWYAWKWPRRAAS